MMARQGLADEAYIIMRYGRAQQYMEFGRKKEVFPCFLLFLWVSCFSKDTI